MDYEFYCIDNERCKEIHQAICAVLAWHCSCLNENQLNHVTNDLDGEPTDLRVRFVLRSGSLREQLRATVPLIYFW